jgi:hypothetical protein
VPSPDVVSCKGLGTLCAGDLCLLRRLSHADQPIKGSRQNDFVTLDGIRWRELPLPKLHLLKLGTDKSNGLAGR